MAALPLINKDDAKKLTGIKLKRGNSDTLKLRFKDGNGAALDLTPNSYTVDVYRTINDLSPTGSAPATVTTPTNELKLNFTAIQSSYGFGTYYIKVRVIYPSNVSRVLVEGPLLIVP